MVHARRFIGRVPYLTQLAQLDLAGERLVTIHGAAGMGKTTLAREHARRSEGEKAAFFADLSSARTLEDVGVALAQALAMPTSAFGGAGEVIVGAARDLEKRGPSLVVLDNFEQLVDLAGAVIEPLLAAKGVSIVVTSREILRLTEETVIELEPLSLPTAKNNTVSEALELLLDRIRRAGGAIDPDVEACMEVVHGLDGIPLALELAAPRIALIGAAAVRDRLGERLDVLSHAPRDAASHQRTLRGAIDNSWNLLEPHEQRALAQCAVFRGAFDLAALEEILDVGESRSVLEALQSLRDKSLVNRGPDGIELPRFALYLSIRDYAREKLAEDAALEAAVIRRHALFYLGHAESLAEQVDTVHGAKALDMLASDRDNLIAVVETSIVSKTPAALAHATRALLALAPLYLARGPMPTLLKLVDAVFAVADLAELPQALVAELQLLRGRCLHNSGRFEEAIAAQQAALDIAKATRSRVLEARAFGELTTSISRRNRHEDSLEMYTESAALHRALGDGRREGIALRRASVFLRELGRLEEARTAARRSVELLDEVGDPAWEALARTELGYIALEEGDLRAARVNAERAVVTVTVSGNWLHRGMISGMLGLVCLGEGSLEAAVETFETALSTHLLQVAAARYEGQARAYLGIALLELDEPFRAVVALERALALLVGVHEQRYRVPFGAFLAAARAAAGDHDRAELALATAKEAVDEADHRRHVVEVLEEVVAISRAATNGALTASHPIARRASERLAAASMLTARGAAAFDLRLAVRYARRVLGPLGIVAPPRDPSATAKPVIVHPEADWFELPTGERATFGRRQAQRLIVRELVRRRLASPGGPVEADELLAIGWPNEQIMTHAAKNRLAVALAAIRKIGLRDLLMNDVRGYFLDPAVSFAWASE